MKCVDPRFFQKGVTMRFGRFRQAMYRFFSGRNGVDQLCSALMWLGLTISVVELLFPSVWLRLTFTAVFGYAAFRMLSRNLQARQRENFRFVRFFGRIGKWFLLQKNKWRDRKTHVYRKCNNCKNTLRLPKITGQHRVCCPCCQNRFEVKL